MIAALRIGFLAVVAVADCLMEMIPSEQAFAFAKDAHTETIPPSPNVVAPSEIAITELALLATLS